MIQIIYLLAGHCLSKTTAHKHQYGKRITGYFINKWIDLLCKPRCEGGLSTKLIHPSGHPHT